MSNEYYEMLKALSEERKLLELELEKRIVEELRKKLREEEDLSKRRTRDSEVSYNIRKIIKVNERDNIQIIGLQGSLGANLLKLGEEIIINTSKSRYFSYLSKNSVLDVSVSSPNSQISLLGGKKIQKQISSKYKFKMPVNEYDDNTSQLLNKDSKKINNSRAAANALKNFLSLQSSSSDDPIIKIYNFVGFRLPWPPSCCLDELTPFVVSDERVFRHLNFPFGSSRIASSAYQKWPTRNSAFNDTASIKQTGRLTYLKFENRLRTFRLQGL
ncbi:hypothetical protein BDF21DRAFT_447729 [Thamnidium elegans]|nr:hypothetical protein BDF21DRAFT_447729 [Thamnidium elegans]